MIRIRKNYLFGMNLPQLGEWKKSDHFLGLLIFLVGCILTVYGGLAFSDSETEKDTKRYPIAKLLLFGSLLSSLFIIL